MAEKPLSTSHSQQTEYQFQLDVHIKKRKKKPLFQAFGKSIYEVEWISQDGPSIVLLKIDGAKASREAAFYVHLSCHTYIVRTLGLVQSNSGSVMLLQECAPQGDLYEALREDEFKPTERVLCKIFEQICDAMMFLAHNGVVHGDLACRNVLIFRSDPTDPNKNLMKLTDFGLTRASSLYSVVDSPAKTTMTIIPTRYAAPELLQETSKLNYSEKSDIYSMGVLMWEACSYGELPYSALESDNDVRQKKLNDERLPRPSLCSDQLWTVINECWHLNPKDRPNFQTLMQFVIDTSIEIDQRSLHDRTNINNKDSNLHNSSSPVKPPVDDNLPRYSNRQINASNSSTHENSSNQQKKSNNELIPCEFCNKLCSKQEFLTHEVHCSKNPNNIVPRVHSDRRRSIKYKNNRNKDDDTIHLLRKDSNRELRDNASLTQSNSLSENFELSSTQRDNNKNSRLPCCCC